MARLFSFFSGHFFRCRNKACPILCMQKKIRISLDQGCGFRVCLNHLRDPVSIQFVTAS